MFFDSYLMEVSFENKFYKLLAEDYEDETDCDKRLWKAKSVCVYMTTSLPCKESYTDVREFTVDEAISWYKNWVKHLNDYSRAEFTVYSMGLFYKKGDEWVLYDENKENN